MSVLLLAKDGGNDSGFSLSSTILNYTLQSDGVESAREMYKRFLALPHPGLKIYRDCIELESNLASAGDKTGLTSMYIRKLSSESPTLEIGEYTGTIGTGLIFSYKLHESFRNWWWLLLNSFCFYSQRKWLMKGEPVMCPVDQHCLQCARRYMRSCLCSTRHGFSVGLGVVSVVSWCVAEIPQIITNYTKEIC